jgi:lysozyme
VQPKPEETPGAIRTEYGGVLVTSEGKAVTAPATVPEVKPAPLPAPTPVAPPRPAPTPQPIAPPRPSAGMPAPQMLPSADDKSIMEMIKKHEGVRTKPYKDSLGLWTVGVGHLIGNGKTLPPEWNREFTMEEIDKLFMEDYIHHKNAAQKIPAFNKMNSLGQGALIDLTFNMGPAWFKSWPTLMKQLSSGDFNSAADNLKNSTWFKQVKSRGVTIVNMIRNAGIEKPIQAPIQTQPSSGTQLAEASTGVSNLRPKSTNTRVMIVRDTQRVSLPAQ